MVRRRARIRFRKEGDLRWCGHRDLMRCTERLFRRAGLALAMSQGFHPKPRMTFLSALALGIEGTDEVLEIELIDAPDADALLQRLAPHAPTGLSLKSVEVLPEGAKKARARSFSYQIPVPAPRRDELAEKIVEFLAAATCPIQRPRRQTTVDLRPLVDELVMEEGTLRMRLRADREPSAGPRDLLAALGQSDLELQGVHLTRTAAEIQP